jgi:hypothetical protein
MIMHHPLAEVFYEDNFITCDVKTHNPNPDVKTSFLRWSAPGADEGLVIQPTNAAYVLLKTGHVNYPSDPSANQVKWWVRLVYEDQRSEGFSFRFYIKFDSPDVEGYDVVSEHIPLMITLGQAGGFWFFLYVLHYVLMSFLSLVISNDSRCLAGAHDHDGTLSMDPYSNI